MSDILQKMRSQSKSTKFKIAIVGSGIITLIIVGFWMAVVNNDKKTDNVIEERSSSEDLKPLFLIFKNIKSGIKNIKSNTQEFREEREKMSTELKNDNLVQ
ncbi:hypothetical protein IT397_00400 [Candidatus Nomurabacteria bacterium]|nr:hypothetical protein [Candidatus Nomurabacteria bacterium]